MLQQCAVRVWSKGPGGSTHDAHVSAAFFGSKIMSTLKTSNIQDTSGNNNSTPEEISQGRAKSVDNF